MSTKGIFIEKEAGYSRVCLLQLLQKFISLLTTQPIFEMKQLLVLLAIAALISVAVCAPISSRVSQQERDQPNSGKNLVNKLLTRIKRDQNAETAAALIQALLMRNANANEEDFVKEQEYGDDDLIAAIESLPEEAQAQAWSFLLPIAGSLLSSLFGGRD